MIGDPEPGSAPSIATFVVRSAGNPREGQKTSRTKVMRVAGLQYMA
jgi:hypothetical protein